MRGHIFVCGVLTICGITVSLCGCSKNEKGKSKTNYVIQEIITNEPEYDTKEPTGISKEEILNPEVEVINQGDEKNLEINPEEVLETLGSIANPDSVQVVDQKTADLINSMPARSIVKLYTVNAATLSSCFYSQDIPTKIYERMMNKSFAEGCTIELKDLCYVRVLHFGFDNEIHIGELVVNKLIADDIIDIFKELFDARYPIEQMVLIDDFDADDNKSMEADNTSCFNYRLVEGTTKLSNHAYGLAIDINPQYNPYVRMVGGKEVIVPDNGIEYADRTQDCEYYIQKDDELYNIFIKRGFTWGGDWETSKDYQHFQKVVQ